MTSEEPREKQVELARAIALDLLALRQRSLAELRRGLTKRCVPSDVAEEVLHRLEEVGLVDDRKFARDLVISRSVYSGRGRARIRQELLEKGIDQDAADEAVRELDEADERAVALGLARRRARALTGLKPHVARRRLMGFLARRGYDPKTVSEATAEALAMVEFSTGPQ